MLKGGIATTILAATVVILLLGILLVQMAERPSPATPASERQAVVGESENPDSLEAKRIELERERIELESLRLKAQIQEDLASVGRGLEITAVKPDDPRKRAALVDAMVAFADDDKVDRAEETDAELAPVPVRLPAETDEYDSGIEPPGFRNYSPDAIAYEDFREPLEPYGDWIQTSNYGPVWQPDSDYIEEGWAPYTNGSWGHSDYGWSWSSRDPFGWACDHYGRWTSLQNRGWCWVPGSEWSTAWVSWRSNGKHIGWVALPPCATWNRHVGIGGWVDAHAGIGPAHYNFVPLSNFGGTNCRVSLIDRARNSELYGATNNVTDLHYRDGCVHNHGPKLAEVEAGSDHLIRKHKLNAVEEVKKVRQRIAVRNGGRGKVVASAPTKIGTARVDRGWSGVVEIAERNRLNRKVVAEARAAIAPGRSKKVSARIIKGGAAVAMGQLPEQEALAAQVIQERGEGAVEKAAVSVVEKKEGSELPDHFLAEQKRRDEAFAAQEKLLAQRKQIVEARQEKERAARQRIDDEMRTRKEQRAQLEQQTLARLERIRGKRPAAQPQPAIASSSSDIGGRRVVLPPQNNGGGGQVVNRSRSSGSKVSSSSSQPSRPTKRTVSTPRKSAPVAAVKRAPTPRKASAPAPRRAKAPAPAPRSKPQSRPQPQRSKAPSSASGRSAKTDDKAKTKSRR